MNGEGSVAGVAVVSYTGRSSTYNAADCDGLSGSTTLVVPTQYRQSQGAVRSLYSAVNIQNLSGSTAQATLTYVDRAGVLPDLVVNTDIPPFSTRGVNTNNGGDLDASIFDPLDANPQWGGSVVIERGPTCCGDRHHPVEPRWQ